MRIDRDAERITVSLSRAEARLLTDQLDGLDEVIDNLAATEHTAPVDPADAVAARLFPDGHHDDPEVSADFRELTRQSLAQARHDRYAQCRAELQQSTVVTLDEPGADRWLMTLNDMRLQLGTRLGITASGRASAPFGLATVGLTMRYHLATNLLESLLAALE